MKFWKVKGAKKLSLFITVRFEQIFFAKTKEKQMNEIIFDTTIKFLQKFRHKLRVCKIITTTAHFSD